jgi:MULE transposase domain
MLTFLFFQYNDISVTKTVVTDKSFSEISAFSVVLPNADQLLCHFHVLQAVDARLAEAKLIPSEKEEIFKYFEMALYARNFDELEMQLVI